MPCGFGRSLFSVLGVGAAEWLVALGWVEDEFADEFAGGGVDDADVEVLGQDEDAGSGVGSADADGVEPALVAQGDLAAVVDPVASDPVVSVVLAVAWGGLGSAGVGGGRGGPVRQGAVWPAMVVLLDKDVEQYLELGDGGRLVGLAAEPLLHRLCRVGHAARYLMQALFCVASLRTGRTRFLSIPNSG